MAKETKQSYEAVFKNRHPVLAEKDSTWRLIENSYLGGTAFVNGDYLVKYPKESPNSFKQRKKRAVYFNQVSPIVDMLSGLLFLHQPDRTIPKFINYLESSLSGDKTINEFMRIVAAKSLMFTCAVLIDSPDYDRKNVPSVKARKDQKLNPYAVLYLPFSIRDFNINKDDGELDWVSLDNSYYSHPDPLIEGKTITEYRIWRRNTFQDYTKDAEGNIVPGEEVSHDLGFVPVRFISWRDDNNDFIGETIFEDIAMISRLIYNDMSYMDEMLASGTFKMLAYPSEKGDMPTAITEGGVGPLGGIPYKGEFAPPSFIGARLQEIDPFIKAIQFYMSEVLKKVGLSTDETKEFVKSGTAKKVDLQKMKALLHSGAMMMGKLEVWMFNTVLAWENKKDLQKQVESEYNSGFSDEDLVTEVTLLTELLIHPIKTLRVEVLKLITKKLLAGNLTPEVLDSIYKDIDKNLGIESPAGEAKVNIKDAAAKIKADKEAAEKV